jgi:predicted ATPase
MVKKTYLCKTETIKRQNMASITIKNIGPIKSVENLELNKINVFMGPQSSGKSTIAKIISFCTWLDKKFSRDSYIKDMRGMINEGKEPNYIKELKTYHRLSEGYFSEESSICFDGEEITFLYNCDSHLDHSYVMGIEDAGEKYKIKFKSGKRRQGSKVIYIPSERNFVSSIYNLNEYLRDKDLIQDFVNNWYEAKRKYSKDHKLDILDLGVKYHNEGDDVDKLTLENGKSLTLQIASSGLQAVVPLVTLFDYIANGIYNESRPMSVSERDALTKRYNEMLKQIKGGNSNIQTEDLHTLFDIIVSKNYNQSQFIIEEPEQNLFPTTQRDLVYYMLRVLNDSERNHRLTFTTHSPYILYALNNCMMGYLVDSQLSDTEKEEYLKNHFLSVHSWIDPKLVSIWEITHEGTLRSIQDKDNIISENYFDQKMTELTDEYYQMLNYYKNEE